MRKFLTFSIALGAIAFAVVSRSSAQGFNGGGFNVGLGPFASGGATLTYTTSDLTQGFGSSSYSSVNIGTVAADRVIVITAFVSSTSQAGCQNAGAAPTVTVGGHTMSTVTQAGESTGGQCQYIYYLFAPAGVLNASTAAVAFTGLNIFNTFIAVGNINGSITTSVNASNGDGWSGGGTHADPRGVTVDLAGVAVATGGIVVTGMGIDRTVTMTANSSNTTVDLNANSGGGVAFMAAHGTNGSPNFNGATNFNANFVIASFKP